MGFPLPNNWTDATPAEGVHASAHDDIATLLNKFAVGGGSGDVLKKRSGADGDVGWGLGGGSGTVLVSPVTVASTDSRLATTGVPFYTPSPGDVVAAVWTLYATGTTGTIVNWDHTPYLTTPEDITVGVNYWPLDGSSTPSGGSIVGNDHWAIPTYYFTGLHVAIPPGFLFIVCQDTEPLVIGCFTAPTVGTTLSVSGLIIKA